MQLPFTGVPFSIMSSQCCCALDLRQQKTPPNRSRKKPHIRSVLPSTPTIPCNPTVLRKSRSTFTNTLVYSSTQMGGAVGHGFSTTSPVTSSHCKKVKNLLRLNPILFCYCNLYACKSLYYNHHWGLFSVNALPLLNYLIGTVK